MIQKLILILALLACSTASALAENSPNDVIESSVALLAEQLNGRTAELAEDRQALYEIIDGVLMPRFDRSYSARLVLSKHWRKATEEQQARFIEAFYRALLRKYADGILEFDPDMITVLPFRGDTAKKHTRVHSNVALDDGSKVAVDYVLVNRQEAGWQVFDVVIEGVSYVRNFKLELSTEIRESSLDAVIERLESEAGISAGK